MKSKAWKIIGAVIALGFIGAGTAQTAGLPPPPPGPDTPAPPSINGGPRISFDATVYEVGKINAGQVLKHSFTFTNSGDQTLEIRNVQPSCGCTTAGTWDRRVEPGKSGSIPIQLNTPNYSGPIIKNIVVSCNDPTHASLTLQIKGTVFKPIEVTPAYVIFNTVVGAETNETKTVRIINNQEGSLSVFEPVWSNALFTAELKTVQPGKQFEVQVTLSPSSTNGYFTVPITLKTSATNMPVISLTAIANVQKPVTVAPAVISLPAGPLAAATGTRATIRNLGGAPLVLSNASVNVPGVEVTIQEVQPGRLFNLAATFPAGFQIAAQQKIVVRVNSNHRDFPVIEIPVFQWQRPPAGQAPPRPVASSTATPGFSRPALPAPPGPPAAAIRPVAADPVEVIPQGLLQPPVVPDPDGPPVPFGK